MKRRKRKPLIERKHAPELLRELTAFYLHADGFGLRFNELLNMGFPRKSLSDLLQSFGEEGLVHRDLYAHGLEPVKSLYKITDAGIERVRQMNERDFMEAYTFLVNIEGVESADERVMKVKQLMRGRRHGDKYRTRAEELTKRRGWNFRDMDRIYPYEE